MIKNMKKSEMVSLLGSLIRTALCVECGTNAPSAMVLSEGSVKCANCHSLTN